MQRTTITIRELCTVLPDFRLLLVMDHNCKSLNTQCSICTLQS